MQLPATGGAIASVSLKTVAESCTLPDPRAIAREPLGAKPRR